MKAVILAAGLGSRLGPLGRDRPKCALPVGGIPIIDRMIARLAEAGITDLVIVTGHCHAALAAHLAEAADPHARAATLVHNERYAQWGNFYSLLVARDAVGDGGFVKLDGDVVLDGAVLPTLLAASGPGVLAIDRSGPLAEEEMKVRVDGDRVIELNKRMDPRTAFGEFIGIERIDAALAPQVWTMLERLIELGETDEYYERAYERLMHDGAPFRYADVSKCTWTEIDDAADLTHANTLAAQRRL